MVCKKEHMFDFIISHYSDVIMSMMVYQPAVVSTICSGTDQRKHQSSTSLAFVRRIHWWTVYLIIHAWILILAEYKGAPSAILSLLDKDMLKTCMQVFV